MRYFMTRKHLTAPRNVRLPRGLTCVGILLCLWPTAPARAGSPDWWDLGLGFKSPGGVLGTWIGAWPGTGDGWDGGGPLNLHGRTGMFLLVYKVHGPDWAGETGFYPEDFESPIPPAGSKTWWNFYLWSQNYTPSPPNQVQVRTVFDTDFRPPDGYRGHLVLDQIPASAGWTGPTDYWLDLTVFNTFTLPIATVTDPLQGTRFHLTVYAIPEPSSLALLGLAALGLAARVIRRRQ